MLFIVNQKGVPSMAKHVRVEAGGKNRNYVRMFTKKFPGEKKHNKGKDRDDDDRGHHGHGGNDDDD
jgi:hypothetical protein